MFGLQAIYFIEHLQTTFGTTAIGSNDRILLVLLVLKQLQCGGQTGRKTNIILQFGILRRSLLLLYNMDHSEFTKTVQEIFVLLMINQEREFLHFRNHASASFLFSCCDLAQSILIPRYLNLLKKIHFLSGLFPRMF